jgi:Na+/proline symporter
MNYDYWVIGGYFALVIIIAFSFKNMATSSTSDYFRGGGKMLWGMVGATAFMAQFSAWTFTGAAGKAFTDGFAISLVFFANTVAYIAGWLYFAKRFRQMRVDTPTQGIRRRFGVDNELFFSWAIMIFGIVNGGVWLNALGVFASSFLELSIGTTIIATGAALVFISVISGAWGVVASDFIQTLVIATVSIACAVVALIEVGGPVTLVTSFPDGFFMGPDMNYGLLLVGSFVFFLAKQMITIMNLNESYRFLSARDSKHATKAALLAAILMGLGSIIFFIPPWASAILYPDAATHFSDLGNKSKDAVYLVFTQRAMPAGTVGLLVAGLFAATMSCMDSTLNKTAGIFVRSVYQPFLAKRNKVAVEKKLLMISMLVSIVVGSMVIFAALYFNSLKELSLFELMMQVSAMIQVPLLVPLLLGLLIKNTPRWAPWMTVFVGFFVSWFTLNIFTPDVLAAYFALPELTRREWIDLNLIMTIGMHVLFTGGFFVLSQLFYNKNNEPGYAEKEAFFDDLQTPVIANSSANFTSDLQQRQKIGYMTMVMGAGLYLMVLIPNPVYGRIMFAICGTVILLIGYGIRRNKGIQELS